MSTVSLPDISEMPGSADIPEAGGEPGRGLRAVATRLITALAILVVWFSLVFPDQLSHVTPGAFLRLPVEGLLLIAVVLVLPRVVRGAVAGAVGLGLGLLAILKIMNTGFFSVLGRPFNPLTDSSYLTSAADVLRDSVGPVRALMAVVAAALVLGIVLLLVTRSTLRLAGFVTDHRASSAWTVSTLALAWLLCAALGIRVAGGPVASTAADAFTHEDAFGHQDAEAALAAEDRLAALSAEELLTGLRGKDVLLVFVESYGRVAVEDPAISPGVDRVLTRGTHSLVAAGFSTRSAFLTSPTFAGISWLAHGTLQSGLWIDNQQRYNTLVESDRLTLSAAFKRAGWRTVAASPSNVEDWPQGTSFYHFDKIYDRRNVGYAGPSFGYASMPDQYTLLALHRNELARPDRSPVMAEIDLVSSHGPWAPLPRMVDWSAAGDGSVFDAMAAQGQSPDDLVGRPHKIKAAYGQSIQYALGTLVSFVETFHNENLVVVAVGDHQPAAVVSGPDASHDVPITIIAHDQEVMDRIGSWGWQPGMLPGPQAPVWPMDAFRDRFLTAYGPQPAMPQGSTSPSPR